MQRASNHFIKKKRRTKEERGTTPIPFQK